MNCLGRWQCLEMSVRKHGLGDLTVAWFIGQSAGLLLGEGFLRAFPRIKELWREGTAPFQLPRMQLIGAASRNLLIGFW
jgi:hypothetical protein